MKTNNMVEDNAKYKIKLFLMNKSRIFINALEYIKFFYKTHPYFFYIFVVLMVIDLICIFLLPDLSVIISMAVLVLLIFYKRIADNAPIFLSDSVRIITIYKEVFGEYVSLKMTNDNKLIHFVAVSPTVKDNYLIILTQQKNNKCW